MARAGVKGACGHCMDLGLFLATSSPTHSASVGLVPCSLWVGVTSQEPEGLGW